MSHSSIHRDYDAVIVKALEELLGLQNESLKESSDDFLKNLVELLFLDERKSSQLAEIISSHCKQSTPLQATTLARFEGATLKTRDALDALDDPMQEDFASESLATTSDRSSLHTALPHGSDDWLLLSAIDRSFIVVSPESLGFQPKSVAVDWSNGIQTKWYDFLLLAKEQVTAKTTFGFFKKKSHRKLATHVLQAGKNYGVLNFAASKRRTTTHFLFEPSTLYVLVVSNEGQESRFSVQVDDTRGLSTNLVEAFGGHEEYAEAALNSMTRVFSH